MVIHESGHVFFNGSDMLVISKISALLIRLNSSEGKSARMLLQHSSQLI